MERWSGKVAVVSGASAGIGAAICLALADAGMKVVGLARRKQLTEALQAQVKGKGGIVSRQCDVAKPEDIAAVFRWVEQSLGCVHVLVNNAGVFHEGQITDIGNSSVRDESIHNVIDVNVKGPIICTRHAVASMKRHGFDGHIITINSIAGHYVPMASNFNVYPSSKHAITAFMNSLQTELAGAHSNIKTTSISPGLVATDMAGDVVNSTGGGFKMPSLQAKDVADAVLYALSTPPTVNIEELTITPVGGLRL